MDYQSLLKEADKLNRIAYEMPCEPENNFIPLDKKAYKKLEKKANAIQKKIQECDEYGIEFITTAMKEEYIKRISDEKINIKIIDLKIENN